MYSKGRTNFPAKNLAVRQFEDACREDVRGDGADGVRAVVCLARAQAVAVLRCEIGYYAAVSFRM